MELKTKITQNYILITFNDEIKAHLPLNNADAMPDVFLLPDLPSWENYIEYMAEKDYIEITASTKSEYISGTYNGFIKGYKKSASKNKFTDNDMIDFAMNMISQYVQGNTNIWNCELLKESLPSSKHNFPIAFKCEIDIATTDSELNNNQHPKIINGVMQGKWIY